MLKVYLNSHSLNDKNANYSYLEKKNKKSKQSRLMNMNEFKPKKKLRDKL